MGLDDGRYGGVAGQEVMKRELLADAGAAAAAGPRAHEAAQARVVRRRAGEDPAKPAPARPTSQRQPLVRVSTPVLHTSRVGQPTC